MNEERQKEISKEIQSLRDKIKDLEKERDELVLADFPDYTGKFIKYSSLGIYYYYMYVEKQEKDTESCILIGRCLLIILSAKYSGFSIISNHPARLKNITDLTEITSSEFFEKLDKTSSSMINSFKKQINKEEI